MKTSLGVTFGTVPLLTIGVALAQSGNVTKSDDGMWGDGWTSGYGGIGVAILIAIVVAGLVAWLTRYIESSNSEGHFDPKVNLLELHLCAQSPRRVRLVSPAKCLRR